MSLEQELTTILQNHFKFKEFRPGQLKAIKLLIEKDVLLCIQPTGYGKSLLYQIPSIYLGGITLVISPLLALMRDQIEQLQNRFGILAASINTEQTILENNLIRKKVLSGEIKILFIAPEQLDKIEQFEFLQQLPIKLLVIDEAHCISTWGHDFRPSYRKIIKLIHVLIAKNPEIKLLGLTATANSKTEMDIKNQMSAAKSAVILRESMNRPNIRLSVITTLGFDIKLATLSNILKTLSGNGLIYCSTRENTEIVATYLKNRGVDAAAYHAGLSVQTKTQLQTDFLNDQYKIISATNALGMGIDKSNLRFVIHFNLPGSITAYYQEVGRCGRDFLPATGILLYDPADIKIQQFFIASSQPTLTEFDLIHQFFLHTKIRITIQTLKQISQIHSTKLNVMLAELIEQGFVEKRLEDNVQVYQLTNKKYQPDLTRYDAQLQLRLNDLDKIQYYAEQSKQCLMSMLRIALGDKRTKDCGQCSVCTI